MTDLTEALRRRQEANTPWSEPTRPGMEKLTDIEQLELEELRLQCLQLAIQAFKDDCGIEIIPLADAFMQYVKTGEVS